MTNMRLMTQIILVTFQYVHVHSSCTFGIQIILHNIWTSRQRNTLFNIYRVTNVLLVHNSLQGHVAFNSFVYRMSIWTNWCQSHVRLIYALYTMPYKQSHLIFIQSTTMDYGKVEYRHNHKHLTVMSEPYYDSLSIIKCKHYRNIMSNINS